MYQNQLLSQTSKGRKSYFCAQSFEKVINLLIHVIAIEWLAAIESAAEEQSAWVWKHEMKRTFVQGRSHPSTRSQSLTLTVSKSQADVDARPTVCPLLLYPEWSPEKLYTPLFILHNQLILSAFHVPYSPMQRLKLKFSTAPSLFYTLLRLCLL